MTTKYAKWTDDDAVRDRQMSHNDRVDILKLKEGRNILRFLPPQPGQKRPWQQVWQHYIKEPGGRLLVFPCPNRMQGKRCPVCEHANSLSRSQADSDQKDAYSYFPKLRVYAEVVDMEATEAGTRVVAFGKTIYEGLMGIRTDLDAGGDFTDVENGFDIIIERNGQGINTSYEVRASRHSGPIADEGWLEKRYDLERFAVLPADHLLLQAQQAIGADVVIDVPGLPKWETTMSISDDL